MSLWQTKEINGKNSAKKQYDIGIFLIKSKVVVSCGLWIDLLMLDLLMFVLF